MSDAVTIAAGGMAGATMRLDAVAQRIAGFGAGTDGAVLPPASTLDLSRTAIDLMEAETSFATNVAVARTARAMTGQLLDVMA